MRVDLKTTGYLYSEYYTITLKKKYAKSEEQRKEAEVREQLLMQVIAERTAEKHPNVIEVAQACQSLFDALVNCWNAQEIVMDSQDPMEVFQSSKQTLIWNKRRNEYIRILDKLFGEQYFSYLEKTYNG